jgi:hypothetical protein
VVLGYGTDATAALRMSDVCGRILVNPRTPWFLWFPWWQPWWQPWFPWQQPRTDVPVLVLQSTNVNGWERSQKMCRAFPRGTFVPLTKFWDDPLAEPDAHLVVAEIHRWILETCIL